MPRPKAEAEPPRTRTRYVIEVQPKPAAPWQPVLYYLAPQQATMIAEYLRDYAGYAGVRLLRCEEAIEWSWKRTEPEEEKEEQG